jgi:glycosyltransferase involved in cell wall biosynthesis
MTGHHVHTIGFGLDLQMFRPAFSCDEETATRQKWNLPLDVPLLLHVGRLDPDKRVDHVIQAAAQTMKTTNAHLLIVGNGTQKPALINQCSSLGISDPVHFTGFIPTNQGLPEIYRIAQLFVTASEIETQGIVLLEAAASGLPLVAVNATCIPELVHDGINGFLAEPGKISMLTNAISLLLKDQEKVDNMGRASRDLAQRHGIHSTIDAHEVLYRQMVRQARLSYVQSRIGQVTVDQKD